METRSLYERLGRIYGIATLVHDFIDRILADPRLNDDSFVAEARRQIPPAALQYLLTELVCWAAGGPQQCTGTAALEWYTGISGQEWDAFLHDLQQTLDKHNVPLQEQDELKVIANSARSNTLPGTRKPIQQIIEATPGAIYVFDLPAQKNLFMNSSVATALGYLPQQVEQEDEFRALMHPEDRQPFLDHLQRLAGGRDEEVIEFEYRMRDAGGAWRWFHSRNKVFVRNEDGSVREIVGTSIDITERKNAEDKTRFIADLNLALAPLADPEEIMSAAVRLLGEYLGVDRCGYAEVEADEDHFVVLGDYTRGATTSIVGRYRMSEFGERERQVLLENNVYVVNDIEAEPPPGTDLSLYERGEIRALVCVPLRKTGKFVARMAVQQKTPRRWTNEEIKLVTSVADRCWESVERAKALRSLKESDERYRAFISNSSEAIWCFELEKPIPINMEEDEQVAMLFQYAYLAECNDAMARMYGYESASEILGARISDLLPMSDPKNIEWIAELKRARFRLSDFETHELDRFGNTKYILNNLTCIQDKGTLVRGWGTQRDITGQKQAQDALRASEERLRRITDATQDALWEMDLNTNQLWWSEAARPLFGQPGELQMALEDWYQRIHPEDAGRVKSRFEKFIRSEDMDWADEYRFHRADGAYVHIQDKGRKFFDERGTPVRIGGAMVDITDRKMAEAELRESEERYRLLTELSPDGVVIACKDGTIQLANPSMVKMLGTTPESVAERNLNDFVAPEYSNHCRDCLQDLMNGGRTNQVEAAFRNEAGTTFPVEINAVRFEWKGQPMAQIVIHDISSRKLAEEERARLSAAIETQRDRLTQILEQMPIGVSIAEAPSGRPVSHNLEAKRLLRHPLLPSEDYKGYSQYGALHADGSPYRPEEYPTARSLISGEVVKGEEMRYRRGDSTETILSVDSAPIYDPEGRMVLIVATFIDIAARKLAEEALRESEERFAKAFQASPDCLVISRISDGVLLEVNESFIAMSGFSRDELIGKSAMTLGLYGNPADRQRMLKILNEQKRVRDFEFGMKRRSGEVRLMLFSAEPLDIRGEHCWLTIGRDITESKRAEEALRRSEEEARRHLALVEAIYATAPVGLCFVDTDLRFRSINDRLAQMNGRSVQDHLGRTLREATPEIAEAVEPCYRRVIDTGEPVLNVELSAAAETATARHFMVSYYPIKNRVGRVLGVNVVVVDITQRKQIEEEREGLLLQEKKAREAAEAANRMKDEFLATISHELRTPLTAILGWANILASGLLTESRKRFALEVIERSARSQARLIDDLLDTSRIITGRLKLDAHPVQIERVFRAALDVIRPSAEAKRITLNIAINDSDAMVLGDANRLQQVLWNLLSNAVKFTSEGGRVEARLSRAGGQVEVSITDTGIGIDPQFLPYVFERFRQADSTSTRTYGGLGLGLAIVRHVVEMHGGNVSVSSSGKGQGSTFLVRFPAASQLTLHQPEAQRSPESPAAQPTPVERGDRLDGMCVLVVEDDLDTLEMLRFILDKYGARVITATSTREALEVLERFRPNALVSDVAMPDQDGYELLQQLRSREPSRGGDIPAVALTAYARNEDRMRAIAAGFQMHVPKPVDPEKLVAVVARLVGPWPYTKTSP